MTGNYDSEELFWRNIYTEEDAMRKIVWNATRDSFNDKTGMEAGFIRETLNISKDDVVLDYGCGIGRLIKAISPHCRAMIGLDVSYPMTTMAKKYLEGVDNYQIGVVGKSDGLPVEDNTADKIYSYIVLQHIHKYKVFHILKELKRILTPGGQGLFQFPDLLKNKEGYSQYAKEHLIYNEYHMATMHFWTQEEAKFIFELAGWKVVDVKEWETDFWVVAE